MGAPWTLTATALHAAFAAGETTPGAALNSCLERLAQVNPRVNAVIVLDEAGARAAAVASDARWQAGAPLGPLDGVPITVKDNLFVGGLPAGWGSRLFEGHIAPRDDIPVARLRAAGAVILGKTNTPELALAGYTDNLVHGPTGNPWAPALTPGGSSGGAVAAAAAGMAPISIATDAGGSLRRPAALAGVATLRPGVGRVPRRWGFPPLAQDFQTIGPIARCVADLRAAFELMADPALPAAPWPVKQRLRAVDGIGGAPVDPDVRQCFVAAMHAFTAMGHEVEMVAAPWDPDEVGALFGTLASAGVARAVTAHPGWEALVTPAIRATAEAGLALPAADYVRAMDRIAVLRAELQDWAREGAVLTPASAIMPWPKAEPFPPEVDGRKAGPRAGAIFSTVLNLAGLPAAVVPCGLGARTGLPVGLQILGGPGSEGQLLDLAAEFEAARPWPHLAPM
jgi:aspartyl-tRNA(Asn)/glutamyl-tRNA(Gln) amidotransferase subunit A